MVKPLKTRLYRGLLGEDEGWAFASMRSSHTGDLINYGKEISGLFFTNLTGTFDQFHPSHQNGPQSPA
jgi:hypothetical protein